MSIKLGLQLLFFLLIVVILSFFYLTFFISEKDKANISKSDIEEVENSLNEKVSNKLVNIEYNATDESGNSYYINAKTASIEMGDNKMKNFVNMDGVVSIIKLIDKGIINIYSDKAVYNKSNHDTFFSGNVNIEYLNNSIYSENLDFNFSEKTAKIFNGVNFKNNTSNLITDKIIINMNTGDIKLTMDNIDQTVSLKSKYELIN